MKCARVGRLTGEPGAECCCALLVQGVGAGCGRALGCDGCLWARAGLGWLQACALGWLPVGARHGLVVFAWRALVQGASWRDGAASRGIGLRRRARWAALWLAW